MVEKMGRQLVGSVLARTVVEGRKNIRERERLKLSERDFREGEFKSCTYLP